MSDRVVSEDLFIKQLELTAQLSNVIRDNAETTRQVATTQASTNALLQRLDDRSESGRATAVDEVKQHVTAEADRVAEVLAGKLEFYNKPQFWLAIAILAGASFAGGLMKVVGLVK